MTRAGELPRLIATDLDGTLLASDGSISVRTLRALERARAAGMELVMVTGRPPRHVAKVPGAAQLGGVVICINGALIYDFERERVLRDDRLSALVARELVSALRLRLPGICFAVEVGLEYGWEPSYGLHGKRTEAPHLPIVDALMLCARGVNKLIARHPQLSPEDMIEQARDLFVERGQASHSGAPFVEISALQVSKGAALAAYCLERNIAPAGVWAFGDMPNDLPMFEWAGHSVAMANAHPSVLVAADETTLSNDAHGVAIILERLLSG